MIFVRSIQTAKRKIKNKRLACQGLTLDVRQSCLTSTLDVRRSCFDGLLPRRVRGSMFDVGSSMFSCFFVIGLSLAIQLQQFLISLGQLSLPSSSRKRFCFLR